MREVEFILNYWLWARASRYRHEYGQPILSLSFSLGIVRDNRIAIMIAFGESLAMIY
jgi:hypothetical protein